MQNLESTTSFEVMRSEVRRPSADAAAGTRAALRDAQLRELANGALRSAAAATGPDEVMDAGVRELIQRVCNVAHEGGLRAEQLLLLLKAAWRELPEGRRSQRHDADVLARVITVCIHEYYERRNGYR